MIRVCRFGPIGSLLLVGLIAIGQVASAASPMAGTQKASFQALGQMPGVVIQPGQCGTRVQ